MWKSILDNAALILGIAISAHTVYAIVRSHVVYLRERRALLADITLQLDMFFSLTAFLAGKAQRFEERYSTGGPPVFENLSDEALLDLEGVRARAEHVLSHPPKWDLIRVGAILNKKQFDLFVPFMEKFNLYWNRLELRLHEFKASPKRDGAFGRFLASASLIDDDNVRDAFREFEKAIGPAAAARDKGQPAP